jgi:hypothetical protein
MSLDPTTATLPRQAGNRFLGLKATSPEQRLNRSTA